MRDINYKTKTKTKGKGPASQSHAYVAEDDTGCEGSCECFTTLVDSWPGMYLPHVPKLWLVIHFWSLRGVNSGWKRCFMYDYDKVWIKMYDEVIWTLGNVRHVHELEKPDFIQ